MGLPPGQRDQLVLAPGVARWTCSATPQPIRVINLEISVTRSQPAVMRADFSRSAVAADRGRHAR